jgi:Bacteriophage CI repressor helix-turn-helix domain
MPHAPAERASTNARAAIERMKAVSQTTTDAELAAELGVTKGAIPNWRKRGVPIQYIVRFADKRSVSIDWLRSGTTAADEVIERMRDALALKSDAALADYLGLPETTVSCWRRRNSIPYPECAELAMRGAARLEWLLTGKGPRSDAGKTSSTKIDPQVLAIVLEATDVLIARLPEAVRPAVDKALLIAHMYDRNEDSIKSLIRTGRFDEAPAARLLDEIAPSALADVPRGRSG